MQFGVFWKIYECLFIPNCTRKIMWLLNNIHEKISRWLSRRNTRVSRNQRRIMPSIAPSRACAWFESKRFDWPSVSFFEHWPIRMLGLSPLFARFSKKKKKHCTALNQSEWRNFFLYISMVEKHACWSSERKHSIVSSDFLFMQDLMGIEVWIVV